MFIETTIHLGTDYLAKLDEAARRSGRSRTEIITHLLKHVMNIREHQLRCGMRVRYQKRAGANSWHILHVRLRPDEYEYFLDLRKLLKLSVSFILALAIDKYLKRLIDQETTDNYQIKNYMIAKRIIDGVTHWILIWGFPPNIEPNLNKTYTQSILKTQKQML